MDFIYNLNNVFMDVRLIVLAVIIKIHVHYVLLDILCLPIQIILLSVYHVKQHVNTVQMVYLMFVSTVVQV